MLCVLMMCYDVKMELTAQLRIVNIPVYSLYNIHTTNTNSITSLIVVKLIEQKKGYKQSMEINQNTQKKTRETITGSYSLLKHFHHLGNRRLVLPQGNHRCLRMSQITNN